MACRTDRQRAALAPRFSRFCAAWIAGWLLTAIGVPHGFADEPLHQQIDRLIGSPLPGDTAPLADDAAFLRRVSLDLVGSIPTADEARAFLDDPDPGKRQRLIDSLLADPRFTHHLAASFDVMLMERRPDKQVKTDEWRGYLHESLQAEKPLNVLAREILIADGADAAPRQAVKFYLDREGEPNLLTRDVGRVFFGMDLQCAQCHDHPHIESYLQADYYGLFSFLNRSFVFTGKDQPVQFAEKAEGDVSFTSVFTEEQGTAQPRLPGGEALPDPELSEEERYLVKPDKDVRPIPKHSRRLLLAEHATDGSNTAFNRNLANRLWAHMMGRGLVHPVDLAHDDNPPSHPELLETLAEALVAMDFQLKPFLRELALSRTYQRPFELPLDNAQQGWAEQRSASLEEVVAGFQSQHNQLSDRQAALQAELIALQDEARSLADPLAAAQTELATHQAAADEAQSALAEIAGSLAQTQTQSRAVTVAVERIAEALALLPADPALSESLVTFQSRGTQLADRLAAEEKQHEAQRQTAMAAAELRDASQLRAAALTERQATLAAREQQLLPELTTLSQQRQDVERQLTAAQREGEGLDRFLGLLEQRDALVARQAQQAEHQASRQAGLARLQQAVAARDELAARATAQQQAVAAVQATFSGQQSATDQRQRERDAIAAAAVSAEQAVSQRPDDAELAAAAQRLGQRLGESDQALAEAGRQQAATEVQLREQQAQVETLLAELETQRQACATRQAELAAVETRLSELAAAVAETEQAARQLEDQLIQDWSAGFGVAEVRALTPEQLAWSLMQATGVTANTRAGVVHELAQAKAAAPMPVEGGDTPAEPAPPQPPTETEIVAALHAKLQGSVNQFVQLFANAGGQPQDVFFTTVEQTLFFRNGGQLRSWIASGGASPRAAALALEDPAAVAEVVYLATLTRRPTPEETESVVSLLAQTEQSKDAAIQELMWGLLTSAEFRFSH